MGWLVEGILDLNLLAAALDRLLSKWPSLAGRFEPTAGTKKTRYNLRFPIGAYPKDYKTYTLTSAVSAAPISDFFTLPLPLSSAPPPHSLFIHSSTPHSAAAWASRHHPLTCWHVTHFLHDGQQYSCIGVTFSHGLFDGMGISYFVHALEAEMLGREWEVPLPLHEGLNVNVLQGSLDDALEKSVGGSGSDDTLVTYNGVTPYTRWMALRFVGWHVWQKWWHGASARVIILPPKAYTALVERTRKEMEADGKSDVRLSTGDVLVAWFFKTIYSDGTPLSRTVHCSSMATIRSFFPETLRRYPHNCFLPLPYPIISVEELQSTPLHVLAHSFAAARNSLSMAHSISMYNTCLNAVKDKHIVAPLPFNDDAQETLAVSNMSIARIVDIDWTGVGGKTTLCRYKYAVNDGPLFTNLLTIAGRTHDGGVVLDIVLTKNRLARLEAEVQELLSTSG